MNPEAAHGCFRIVLSTRARSGSTLNRGMQRVITSTANEKVKRLVNLSQKSKLRHSEGVFIAEGMKMFLEAPQQQISEAYVSEGFLEKNAPEKLNNIRYEIVSDEVFKKISDTQTPQGILCVMKMPRYTLDGMLCAGKDAPLILLLEDIQDPGNLGTIMRTGEGAGIDGVIMTKKTVDIFNPKVIRSTMGSIYRVPFITTDDILSTIRGLKSCGVKVYAAHLDGSADYDTCDYTEPAAFLIGNEANGLRSETAAAADCCVRIPLQGQAESLNAAVAAAVLAYEASRQRRKA